MLAVILDGPIEADFLTGLSENRILSLLVLHYFTHLVFEALFVAFVHDHAFVHQVQEFCRWVVFAVRACLA